MIFLPPTRYNGLLEFDSLVHTPTLGAIRPVSRQAFVGPQGQNSGSAHAYVGPGAETVVGFTRRQSERTDRRYRGLRES